MRIFLVTASLVLISVFMFSQEPSSKYERGTVTAVTRHESAPGDTDQVGFQYDISVQVRNTIYVVLYTAPHGANSVEYAPGLDFLVKVGKDTLTISNKLSGSTEVPILRTETLPAQPSIDWSKAPSQYFSMKMQNLSESLDLTEEQQAKLKPIAEQESGEAGQVIFTSVISRKERLNRWEKIVRSSDAKMKSFLSQAQWQKLQEIRKEQKAELKKLIAERETSERN
jgi:Spy/CpxP family protein refolding chaperone